MDENNDQATAERRRFIQRMVGSAAFAVPTVRTFMMVSALGAGAAEAAAGQVGPTTTETTTSANTTTKTTAATTTLATTSEPTTTKGTTTTGTTFPTTTSSPTTTSPFFSTTVPGGGGGGGGGDPVTVPEIKSMSIGAALTLLASSVLVVRDRMYSSEGSAATPATDSSEDS